MITILTRSGYILKHSWNASTNRELIIKKSMLITKDGYVYNDTMLYLKNNWDQDVRFKSMYLDKVVSITTSKYLHRKLIIIVNIVNIEIAVNYSFWKLNYLLIQTNYLL